MEPLIVYVPQRHALSTIPAGSGIVGRTGAGAVTIDVYFEDNRFNNPGLRTWEQRVRCAGDRLIHRSPTGSLLRAAVANLMPVGSYDGQTLTIDRPDVVRAWVSVSA